ncbi:MAG: N-acetylmuramoyl-L-alanine amidase [Ruminococcaceae bacterium]|nr:N-acetylmuramoyl-L-alanine amidase [Oscillospiraceae bacterium]
MAIKIYIDQGHNPINPNAGAEGNGLREQDIVLRVGLELADLLLENGNFEVLLSRPSASTQLGTSTASSLAARVNAANSFGADAFISLHTNAAASPAATGSEAFVFSRPSAAYELASDILRRMTEVTGLDNRGVFVRNGLYVLRKTQMPATLVELGFITNPSDATLMNENPRLFATGIYQGILDYFNITNG